MKQKTLKSVMTVLLALFSLSAYAYDVEYNGIYYDLDESDMTASVTNGGRYNAPYSGIVNISETCTYMQKTFRVTSIGQSAFEGCSFLTSVSIPNSVTSIGYGAFYGCSSLTAVNIPNSVTSIGPLTFYGCSSLTTVDIPNSVTSIGSSAFSGCSSLTSVSIPNSVTFVDYEAFYGTPWYNNQPNGLIYAGRVAYTYKGTMPNNTSIIIKEGTISISNRAFWGRSYLTSVSIPNSVTTIGWAAFSGCI